MASLMRLHFNVPEENIFEHTNGKCYLCTLQSTCRLLCNTCMYLIFIIKHNHAKISINALVEHQISWAMIMLKLLIFNGTFQTPQNRVGDTIMHVTLNAKQCNGHSPFSVFLTYHTH